MVALERKNAGKFTNKVSIDGSGEVCDGRNANWMYGSGIGKRNGGARVEIAYLWSAWEKTFLKRG